MPKPKKNKRMNIINYCALAYLIVCFIVGGLLLREAYKLGLKIPNGEIISKMDVGVVEILSPAWVPVFIIAEIITTGVDQEESQSKHNE